MIIKNVDEMRIVFNSMFIDVVEDNFRSDQIYSGGGIDHKVRKKK